MARAHPAEGGVPSDAPAFPLPPLPGFSTRDVRGNLAEAMLLRCIGSGQPIKASWLCRETLEIFRRHRLPPNLELVETLRLLTLCYADDIKRGSVANLGAANTAIAELAALGGIPESASFLRRCMKDPSWDPLPDLGAFRVRVPPDPAAGKAGEAPGAGWTLRTPRMRIPVAEISPEDLPSVRVDAGILEPSRLPAARILVEEPVRRQARFDSLYLEGVVCMSQAYRIEKGRGGDEAGMLQQELPFLAEGAWWMHLAGLVAGEAPVGPEECFRKARARSSMLIRRIETGKHFEMAGIESLDFLE